jgi:hypothetical protein
MAKYGRGLNREVVAAVNNGSIREPFTVEDVRHLIRGKRWNPPPTANHVVVTLANGASDSHSDTYKKYFRTLGDGQYRLRDRYRGDEWL